MTLGFCSSLPGNSFFGVTRQQTQSGAETGIVSPVILGRVGLRGGHRERPRGCCLLSCGLNTPRVLTMSLNLGCEPAHRLPLVSPILAAHSHHLNAMRLAPRTPLEGRRVLLRQRRGRAIFNALFFNCSDGVL